MMKSTKLGSRPTEKWTKTSKRSKGTKEVPSERRKKSRSSTILTPKGGSDSVMMARRTAEKEKT